MNPSIDKTNPPTFPLHAKNVRISVLKSAVFYFLDFVFIMEYKHHFRLMVIHDGRLLTDENYDSAGGARVAFSRLYRHCACEAKHPTEWSIFYQPSNQWLKARRQDILAGFSNPEDHQCRNQSANNS